MVGVLFALLALGTFYWFRTEHHRAALTQRNLRDLARIARAIEAKVNNLEQIVGGLRPTQSRASLQTGLDLVPHAIRLYFFDASRDSASRSAPPTTCAESSGASHADGVLLWIHASRTSLCVEHRSRDDRTRTEAELYVLEFDLVGLLEPALHSSFFDEIFLADEAGEVFLHPTSGGQRLRRVPARASGEIGGASAYGNTGVYDVVIGGRRYILFQQPVDLKLPSATADSSVISGVTGPTRWRVGGLANTETFRSEGLALDPGELSVLLALLVLAVLASPLVKLWTMGERERVTAEDAFFLGLSFLLGSGIVAIGISEGAFFWSLDHTFDEQLTEIGEEMADHLHDEIGHALAELNLLTTEFHDSVRAGAPQLLQSACPEALANDITTSADTVVAIYDCLAEFSDTTAGPSERRDTIQAWRPLRRTELPWRSITPEKGASNRTGPHVDSEQATNSPRLACRRLSLPPVPRLGETSEEWSLELRPRFPYFRMVVWVNSKGFQVAKWSPDSAVTPMRSVRQREYFQRISRGKPWRWKREASTSVPDGDPCPYFLEVIRSINTGEILVALSSPFAPRPDLPSSAEGWASVMITQLASVDRPVLPPGFGFAVIQRDGQVVFHSLPERALETNFFEEADDDPGLRSATVARVEEFLSLRYLGKDVRLFLTPIRDSPLSLIIYYDRAYPGTIAFETMVISLTMFGSFALLLFVLCVGLHLGSFRSLSWAWPSAHQEHKQRLLLIVFVVLGLGSVPHLLLAVDPNAADRFEVHVLGSTYLIALFAVACIVVVMAERRVPRLLGLLLGASVVAILAEGVGHWLRDASEGSVRPLQLLAPFFAVVVGCWLIDHWRRTQKAFGTWLTSPGWVVGNLYSWWLLSALLVIGMLPATVSFAVLGGNHLELLVRHAQLHLAEELVKRDERIRAQQGSPAALTSMRNAALYYRSVGVNALYSAEVAPLDVPATSAFDTCYRPPPVYGPAPSTADETTPWVCAPNHNVGADASGDWEHPGPAAHDPLLHWFVDRHLPFFTEVSVQTRKLYHPHVKASRARDPRNPSDDPPRSAGDDEKAAVTSHDHDRGWWWSVPTPEPDMDGAFLRLTVASPQAPFAISSRVPVGIVAGLPLEGPALVVGALVLFTFLAGLFYLIRFVARAMFLADLDAARAVSVPELTLDRLPAATIIVTPWVEDRIWFAKRDDCVFIDRPEHWRIVEHSEVDPTLPQNRTLVVDGLGNESGNLTASARTLGGLERLCRDGCRILLLVDRNPDEIFLRHDQADRREHETPDTSPASGAGTDASDNSTRRDALSEQWARLLSSFTKIVVGRPPPAGGPRPAPPATEAGLRNEQHLRSECAQTRALRAAEDHVRRHPEFGRLSDEELYRIVLDAAAGQYRRVWNGLGHGEQMALAQIAHGATSLSKRNRTISRLLSLGLLEREPYLRLMNRSFADFVRNEVPPRQLKEWESMAQVSTWQALRQPLLIIVGVVAVFLLATQREVFDAGIALVTAMAAAAPPFVRLLAAVTTRPPPAPKS